MFALPLLGVWLASAADVTPPPEDEPPTIEALAPEPFTLEPMPLRAGAWILAEQASLFTFNGWILRPPAWEPPSWELFQEAWTRPTLPGDDDGFVMNAFMHPVMGAHFYMAGRNHGLTVPQSALVVVLGSFVWEYVIESWFTRPVTYDLIATPLLGVPLGMVLSHLKQPIRRIGPRWLRGVVMLPVDPIEGVDTLLLGGPPRRARW